jgi:histidinol-phosphate aminotransferase
MSYDYERVATPSSGLRLHLNENTAGCSPRVLEAIQSLTREQAAFYPDYDEVVARCAARFGVSPGHVLLTNGLDEGILACSLAAARAAASQAEAIVVVPAFDMYAACADVAGARVVEVTCGPDFEFPIDGVLRAIGPLTRIIFLTTPNNPTGQSIAPASILKIASAAPAAIVFVDEAYIDFGGETLLGSPELARFPNILIGRTFAKAYGLAALRAGALIGPPVTLGSVRRIVPPYSVNVCAVVALQAALQDADYYQWYLKQVSESKALLYEALDRLGIKYWRSSANFVFARFGADAARIVNGLAEKEVFVRDRSRDPACPGCVRMTAGIVEHTRTCIAALEEVVCGAAS